MMRKMERRGLPLCSRRDPVKEALDWVRWQNLMEEDQRVLIFGFGAGFHVEALQAHFPKIEISLFELDPELLEECKKRGITAWDRIPAESLWDAYLDFRPSWSGLHAEFLEAYENAVHRRLTPDQEASPQWSVLQELVR